MSYITKYKKSDLVTSHTNNTSFTMKIKFLDSTVKTSLPRNTTRTTKENPIVRTEFILNFIN